MSESRSLSLRLAPVAAPIAVIIAWEALRTSSAVNPSLLPPVTRVATRALSLLSESEFWAHWSATMGRVGLGFVLAGLAGVLAGVAMGYNRVLFKMLVPAVDFFRSVPVTTLYPVFVLAVGIGNLSKIGMIVAATVFVVALNTAYGVSRSSDTRRALARLYGATREQVLLRVVLMESLPQVFVGLRVSISLAVVVSILTELFMGAQRGLGQRIMETYSTYLVTDMYAFILWTGVTGYVLNRGMAVFERRIVPWAEARQP